MPSSIAGHEKQSLVFKTKNFKEKTRQHTKDKKQFIKIDYV